MGKPGYLTNLQVRHIISMYAEDEWQINFNVYFYEILLQSFSFKIYFTAQLKYDSLLFIFYSKFLGEEFTFFMMRK